MSVPQAGECCELPSEDDTDYDEAKVSRGLWEEPPYKKGTKENLLKISKKTTV